jgi:hypothetical protein
MTEAMMKSLAMFKVLFVLLGTVASPVVVFAGITQIHLPVETPRKTFTREAELKRGKVLESKVRSQISMQNLSSLNAINHPVNDVQIVRVCNSRFSSCPIP